jgi:hypothetical protein
MFKNDNNNIYSMSMFNNFLGNNNLSEKPKKGSSVIKEVKDLESK